LKIIAKHNDLELKCSKNHTKSMKSRNREQRKKMDHNHCKNLVKHNGFERQGSETYVKHSNVCCSENQAKRCDIS